MRLFICALWSPAGKGLTSWSSCVVSNCEFVTILLPETKVISFRGLYNLLYFSVRKASLASLIIFILNIAHYIYCLLPKFAFHY